MKTENKDQYQEILKFIDVSFLNKDLLELLKTNKTFKNLIIKLISMINYYETNNLVDEHNYQRLISAYSSIFKSDFDKNKILYASDEDFADTISYFPIFVKNTLHKTFTQIENEMNNVTDAPVVQSEVVENNEQPDHQKASSNEDHNKHHNKDNKDFNAESFINQNGYTINEIADQMVMGLAANVLRQKIITGEVYAYRTKPKFIFALKIISIILFITVMILSIVSVGLSASMNGKFTVLVGENNKLGNLGTIDAFSIISLVFYLLIVGFIIWGLVKNNKNENYKYRFNWGMPLFYLALSLIMILADLNSAFLSGYNSFMTAISNPALGNTILESNSKWLPTFDACRIVEFVKYGILGAILIIVILAASFNPKKDIERMNLLIEQYANEIKSGMNDYSEFSNGPGFAGGLSSLF